MSCLGVKAVLVSGVAVGTAGGWVSVGIPGSLTGGRKGETNLLGDLKIVHILIKYVYSNFLHIQCTSIEHSVAIGS